MTVREWCELIADTIDFFHLSPVVITEKAESSLKTTERIRACSIDQDILRGTARRYELAVFGTANKHICAMDIDINAAEKIAALEKKLEETKQDRDRLAKVVDRLLEK